MSVSWSTGGLKRLSVVASGLKNLQNSSDVKKNTCQSQRVSLFLKKHINLTEKQLFIRFHFVALITVSLHGKISLNFRIKFGVSFSIKHIKPLLTILY